MEEFVTWLAKDLRFTEINENQWKHKSFRDIDTEGGFGKFDGPGPGGEGGSFLLNIVAIPTDKYMRLKAVLRDDKARHTFTRTKEGHMRLTVYSDEDYSQIATWLGMNLREVDYSYE